MRRGDGREGEKGLGKNGDDDGQRILPVGFGCGEQGSHNCDGWAVPGFVGFHVAPPPPPPPPPLSKSADRFLFPDEEKKHRGSRDLKPLGDVKSSLETGRDCKPLGEAESSLKIGRDCKPLGEAGQDYKPLFYKGVRSCVMTLSPCCVLCHIGQLRTLGNLPPSTNICSKLMTICLLVGAFQCVPCGKVRHVCPIWLVHLSAVHGAQSAKVSYATSWADEAPIQ
ncbi:hypothetical protein BHE74_00034959 [Ensete ventricosum]|nr:hypothetical protein BHE74_00034959 [Ensete ventricosum]